MNLKPDLTSIPEHKALYNIGSLFDIPTGYPIPGLHGETIWMGGYGNLTAVVGGPNTYKSTILHYQNLSAMAKVFLGLSIEKHDVKPTCVTMDTEMNVHPERLRYFATRFEEFGGIDIIDEGIWTITDQTIYLGNEFWQKQRDYMMLKRKNAKELMVRLPFNDRHGKPCFEIAPTFSEIDSLSEMRFQVSEDISDKNEIGEGASATIFMREGGAKSQMLHQMPTLSAASRHYVGTTAHVGDVIGIGNNTPPKRQMQHLPVDSKIKKVAANFLFLQHNLWFAASCSVFTNSSSDKSPKYPRVQGDSEDGDKDLNIVTLQHVRGKAGLSGFRLHIIVSQAEGVLPTLTEFNYLKDMEGFGIQGNDRNYQMVLLPEENLSRTTVRMKIDENKKLRRAINITSELCQLVEFHRAKFQGLLMKPEELYVKLKEQKYDIDWLLENTRGWWTYNNDRVGQYFLSTIDLLKMARDLYVPYYFEDDRKTVKKEFLRKVTT